MPLSSALALTLSIKGSFALKVEKKPLSMGFKESLLMKARERLMLRLGLIGK